MKSVTKKNRDGHILIKITQSKKGVYKAIVDRICADMDILIVSETNSRIKIPFRRGRT